MSNLDSMNNDAGRSGGSVRRPYIGVHFECCGIYTRVYRRPQDSQYTCRCPRCLRVATVRVGTGGTSERFFRVR